MFFNNVFYLHLFYAFWCCTTIVCIKLRYVCGKWVDAFIFFVEGIFHGVWYRGGIEPSEKITLLFMPMRTSKEGSPLVWSFFFYFPHFTPFSVFTKRFFNYSFISPFEVFAPIVFLRTLKKKGRP